MDSAEQDRAGVGAVVIELTTVQHLGTGGVGVCSFEASGPDGGPVGARRD